MSDPFREFVEGMARLAVPEDDTEENQERREAAASDTGTPLSDLDESDIVASADDEFLCSEARALIGRGGRIPMHPDLRRALTVEPVGPVIRSIAARRGCWSEVDVLSQ